MFSGVENYFIIPRTCSFSIVYCKSAFQLKGHCQHPQKGPCRQVTQKHPSAVTALSPQVTTQSPHGTTGPVGLCPGNILPCNQGSSVSYCSSRYIFMDTFLSTKMKSSPIMLIGQRFPRTLVEILLVKPRGETMRGRSCLWLVPGPRGMPVDVARGS